MININNYKINLLKEKIETLTNKKILLQEKIGKGKFELPSNHKPGVKVPKGGAMCGNCEYLSKDSLYCTNKYMKQWMKSDKDVKLPYPANEYCCDWWEH